ncbi:unnamed protein product [Gordionus sp. m RMFG-2023]
MSAVKTVIGDHIIIRGCFYHLCQNTHRKIQKNLNESTLSDEERTFNQCEGWNHRLSNLVGNKHPSFWVLIKKMKFEVAADETKLEHWRVGY